MRPVFLVVFLMLGTAAATAGEEVRPRPVVPAGWNLELVAEAPAIRFPTASVVGPDGTLYLGQDPMDMPGPPTEPIDSIVALKGGKVAVFADKLWAVMGLEWAGDTLYVVHPPFLSAFRDKDGDGKADDRVDLMTGLGPKQPGFNGINDHVPSGLRLGMDGYLYIAVGDKGIPQGVGKDGASVRLHGGGVVRIRTDGTGLEVVSSGERNPLSVMLTSADDVFTYGNDDDSKKWPNSLTHHIAGGHYGYPYQFLSANGETVALPTGVKIRSPRRCLPVTAGQVGGSGTQGLCYDEAGLPERYRGNLFVCDWGLATVFRYELEPAGATFRVKVREAFVTKGELADFRPFSLSVDPRDGSLYLVDWAFTGWLADGPVTGRVYHLTYQGPDRPNAARKTPGDDPADLASALDAPSRRERLEAQRRLVLLGDKAVPALLGDRKTEIGRVHALFALRAIGGSRADGAIASALRAKEPGVRLQGARLVGLYPRGRTRQEVEPLLRDKEPAVRCEAAIALGRLGDRAAGAALMGALGDPDVFVAWSVRHAIRALGAWDETLLTEALLDPRRRDDALDLTDEAWSVPVIEALAAALAKTADVPTRVRLVTNLAGLYRRYPEWSGNWFGTNPLVGEYPRKTKPWSAEGMGRVLATLAGSLNDADRTVRREAIAGLREVGTTAAPALRTRLAAEPDAANAAALAEALGALRDNASTEALVKVLNDRRRDPATREAALRALAMLTTRPAANARLMLVYDESAPPELVAAALATLARSKALPPNDLAEFLDHKAPRVRASVLDAMAATGSLSGDIRPKVTQRLDDRDPAVRKAAIAAVAACKVREAIPKLLDLARSAEAEDAKLALAALPDPRAIASYIDDLNSNDTRLRNAAEGALLKLRDLAAGALESRLRAGTLKPYAAEATERIVTRMVPVAGWKVIGPFPRTTARVFVGERSIDFARPHVGAEGRRIAWQARPAEPVTGRVVLEDLKAGAGDRGGFGYESTNSPELSVFAYAEIVAEAERTALLRLGSSGPLLVTLNERVIYDSGNFAGRAYQPDSDRLRVTLAKGTNRVLLRSKQGIGTWCFSLQVSDPAATLAATAPGKVSFEELRAYAMTHEGDPARGRAIFFDPKGIGCVKCHAAGGSGTASVGPDLTGLAAKYDRAEIVRSVLEPSNRLATGYQPVLIARADGAVVTGLVRSESDAQVELVDADAKVTVIPKSEIEERKVGDTSIMPTGLIDNLSPGQFADLIAFLASLKAAPAAGPKAP